MRRMPAPKTKRTLAALAALAAVSTLAACGDDDGDSSGSDASSSPSASESTSAGATASSEAAGSCEYVEEGGAAKEVDLPPSVPTVSGKVPVTIETTAGTIGATLDAAATPCTVNSFVSLAEQGFYDETPCPRIVTEGIKVLQCGDPTGTGSGGPGYRFADELTGSETYAAGSLAMANAGPDTNGSQFFVVYGESDLAPNYTLFGQVDPAGLKLIEKVAADGHDNSHPAGGGTPNTPVDITKVTVG